MNLELMRLRSSSSDPQGTWDGSGNSTQRHLHDTLREAVRADDFSPQPSEGLVHAVQSNAGHCHRNEVSGALHAFCVVVAVHGCSWWKADAVWGAAQEAPSFSWDQCCYPARSSSKKANDLTVTTTPSDMLEADLREVRFCFKHVLASC